MNIIKISLFFLLLSFSTLCVLADDSELLNNLEYGGYGVGFELIEVFDHGRPFYNKSTQEFVSRPVQISLWYPAKIKDNPEYYLYRDYVLNSATELSFARLNSQEKQDFISLWISSRVSRGINKDYLEEILNLKMRAARNSQRADGKFPLIIYSSSFNSSPYENSVAIEFLVSHGFIVAAYPSNGLYSGVMTGDWQGVVACVQDAEFVLNHVCSYQDVDIERIGGMGFSWGGITMSYLATYNYRFDAFVCLDGSLIKGFKNNNWKEFPYYNPDKVLAPFMHMTNRNFKRDPQWEFHSGIDKTISFEIIFHKNEHHNFCSSANIIDYVVKKNSLRKPSEISSEKGFGLADSTKGQFHNVRQIMKQEKVKVSYEATTLYALKHFQAFLKNDSAAQEFLTRKPEDNGIKAGILTYRIRPPEAGRE